MKFEECKIGDVVKLDSDELQQGFGDKCIHHIKASSNYFIIANKNLETQTVSIIPITFNDHILPSCLQFAGTLRNGKDNQEV